MSLLDEGRVEDLNTFHAWLMKAVERGPVAVITGKNGDMDTVGSAVALASSHPHLMACGLHLGRIAKKMVEHHRAPFRKLTPHHRAWPSDLAGLIVVDAAAESQTGLTLPDVPKCILDHHATKAWNLGDTDLACQPYLDVTIRFARLFNSSSDRGVSLSRSKFVGQTIH